MLNKIFIIIFILLSYTSIINAKVESKRVDSNDIKSLNLELESKNKTKKDYEKKENLLKKPLNKEESLKLKNTNDLNIDGTVDINKDKREIENVKINLGKNF